MADEVTQGTWGAYLMRGGEWAFYPSSTIDGLGARVRSRQDCEDLIALLERVKERLPDGM